MRLYWILGIGPVFYNQAGAVILLGQEAKHFFECSKGLKLQNPEDWGTYVVNIFEGDQLSSISLYFYIISRHNLIMNTWGGRG